MSLDPLLYRYEVRNGTGFMTANDQRWQRGKRIMRISVKCGPSAGGQVFLTNHPTIQTTIIDLDPNETLCLAPDGAGTSVVIDAGTGGKWLIEAWEPQGATAEGAPVNLE